VTRTTAPLGQKIFNQSIKIFCLTDTYTLEHNTGEKSIIPNILHIQHLSSLLSLKTHSLILQHIHDDR